MASADSQPSVFAFDLYQRSQEDLRTLKSRLPEESVAGLAKEVLLRVAGKSEAFSIEEHAPQIEELCNALIGDDPDAGAAYVRKVLAEGASLEDVYLGYLAGAARMLGKWWENDLASFSEVTIGTSRMYAIMRAMRHLFTSAVQPDTKSAVFAAVPGDTHTLGVRMATDIFNKDGWDIDLKSAQTHDELLAEIVSANAAIIGLSAAGRHSLDALARLVVALRIVNPGAYILVSGQIVNETEDLISIMDVDEVASDIPSGRIALENLWERTQAQTS